MFFLRQSSAQDQNYHIVVGEEEVTVFNEFTDLSKPNYYSTDILNLVWHLILS